MNPLYTADELAKQLQDSGARLLVTVPPFLDKAREAAAQEPASRRSSCFGRGRRRAALRRADAGAATSRPRSRIDPANDLVVLPYSSGTTGLPKGVMLTHRNLVANLCQARACENFEASASGTSSIAVLPFFHIYGMVVIMMLGLAGGGTIVVMPRFDLHGVPHASSRSTARRSCRWCRRSCSAW